MEKPKVNFVVFYCEILQVRQASGYQIAFGRKMIESEELLTLMPHRGRMFLISRVIKYDSGERSIEAEYDITEDCLFYDSLADGVPAWAGFEFIAQAISAIIGIEVREKGLSPKKGYILGISQTQISIPYFKTGSTLTIKSRELDGVDPVYIFTGEIFLNDREVLSGKLTVMDVYDK